MNSQSLVALLGAVMISTGAGAVNTVINNNATALASALSGSGFNVVSASLSGNSASGTFTNGAGAIGIANGVVLSTGANLSCIGSSNSSGSCGEFDGATSRALSIDFTSAGASLFFNYAFGSEEYNSFVGSQFNDTFSLTLTGPGYAGVNLAQLPGGSIVSINNVNLNANSAFFRNNSAEGTGTDTGGPGNTAPSLNLPIELDGLTTVLAATATNLTPGALYNLTFNITDVGDTFYDSAVFIQAGSVGNIPVASDVPEPATWAMMVGGFGLTGAAMRRRRPVKLAV